MSVRLVALTTPSNSRWVDIEVVADGSDTVGYSLTQDHWDYCNKLRAAVEYISGVTVEDLMTAYNKSAIISRNFYLYSVGVAKESFSAEIDKDIIQNIFNKAYKVVEGSIAIHKMDVSYLRGKSFWKTMGEKS